MKKNNSFMRTKHEEDKYHRGIEKGKKYDKKEKKDDKDKKKRRDKIKLVMDEWKEGKLHSGSKKGPLVNDRKQAIAIALSEARRNKK